MACIEPLVCYIHPSISYQPKDRLAMMLQMQEISTSRETMLYLTISFEECGCQFKEIVLLSQFFDCHVFGPDHKIAIEPLT